MKTTTARLIATVTLGCAALLSPGCAPLQPPADPSCTLSLDHVVVLTMESERELQDRRVTFAGDRIKSIEPSGKSGQTHCQTAIDASGKYLLPGLNDMHVHVESQQLAAALGGRADSIAFEDVLYLYLAHGVTGIRIMSGAPDILAFRNSHHGSVPRMLVASPMLAGQPPELPEPIMRVLETPEEAVEAVNAYADAGYNFIKIRANLVPPVLRAVIDTATARKLDVDGHLPRIANPLATGQRGIAHLDELSLRVKDAALDPQKFADQLVGCHCYVTTTMVVEQNAAAQLRSYDALASRPELRFINPLMKRAMWDRERNPYLAAKQDPAFFDRLLETDRVLLRAFASKGVPLMAGTDALNPMIIPGDSLHDELHLIIEAGFTPFEALRMATVTPSEVFAGFRSVGILAPGRSANAILVSGDPLKNLDSLRRPDAVIIDGVLIDRATLDRNLEEIATRMGGK